MQECRCVAAQQCDCAAVQECGRAAVQQHSSAAAQQRSGAAALSATADRRSASQTSPSPPPCFSRMFEGLTSLCSSTPFPLPGVCR